MKYLADLFPGSPKICLNKRIEGAVVLQRKFLVFSAIFLIVLQMNKNNFWSNVVNNKFFLEIFTEYGIKKM